MNVEKTAKDIANWVGNGIGDMAYDMVEMWKRQGKKGEPALEKLAKEGVVDIAGRYADDMYNDPVVLSDMMGDRVCDEVGWDDDKARKELIDALRKCHSFSAWQEACTSLEK